MANIKDLSMQDLLKGSVVIVVAFVAAKAWMESRFIAAAMANDCAKKEKANRLQSMITYQQLSMVLKKNLGVE